MPLHEKLHMKIHGEVVTPSPAMLSNHCHLCEKICKTLSSLPAKSSDREYKRRMIKDEFIHEVDNAGIFCYKKEPIKRSVLLFFSQIDGQIALKFGMSNNWDIRNSILRKKAPMRNFIDTF